MYNIKNLSEKIEKCVSKIFEKDIVGDTIVIVNGNSTNKNDLVVTMSRKAYDKLNEDIINDVIKDYGKD